MRRLFALLLAVALGGLASRAPGPHRTWRWILVLLGVCTGCRLGSADTHYVGTRWPGGPYPYTSRETAAYFPEDAIDAADRGDLVVFAPASYGAPDRPLAAKADVTFVGSGPEKTFFRYARVDLVTGVRIAGVRFVNSILRVYDLSAPGPVEVRFQDCLFDGASVEWIHPAGHLYLKRCAFVNIWDSQAVQTWPADVSVSECVFDLARYGGARGAVGIAFSEGDRLEVSDSTFRGCSTAIAATGSSATITNCLFLNNGYGVGAAIGHTSVRNCTFFDNDYAIGAGGEYSGPVSLRSSILWGNRVSAVSVGGPEPTYVPDIAFCDVEGGYPGRGNIDADPVFFLPSGDDPDLHLCAFSPCIDAGDPFSDYSNEPEPNGGRVNMGAYGNTWEATTSELVDMDADNMRDDWETENFGNLEQDGLGDADGDGLSDREEYRYLTDPNNPDTDSDGLLDGEEVSLGTDPLVPDTDNDGTPDAKEVAQGTNPLDPWDAFTITKFWIEDDKIHVVHPVQPRYWFELESSFWPNGPFGGLSSEWQGRWGVTTHTFIADLNPHTQFFRVKARSF